MDEQKTQGARNFFLYFLLFALLYVVAINFGGLLFDLIDKTFAVPGSFRAMVTPSSLRFHVASLIIAVPIYLFLAFRMQKNARSSELLKHSGVRRWLTYITLLITTLVVVGDLIALVFRLLGGDTTTQFVLKALVVLFIATAILYYYLNDLKGLRSDIAKASAISQIYFYGTAVLVVVAVVLGFLSVGSPAAQRMINNDQLRINNLQQIEYAISQYAAVEEKLPESLDDLIIQPTTLIDPITDARLEYAVLTETTYELCATFETSNLSDENLREFYYPDSSWLHNAERTCFKRTVADTLNKPSPAGTIEMPSSVR